MDLDGNFVITWESVVPDSANYGSVSDIFARRFSPAGFVSDPLSEDITFTTSRPMGRFGTFTLTTGKGTTSAISLIAAHLAGTWPRQSAVRCSRLGYDPADVRHRERAQVPLTSLQRGLGTPGRDGP